MYSIMKQINNFFVRSSENGNYEIVADGIIGTFSNTYIAGSYLIIKNSFLNDDIYKILSVTSTKLVLDAILEPENTKENILLVLSSPPKDFIALATEIVGYNEKGVGVSSEGLDDYSVSYNTDGSWENIYKTKLIRYRRVYSDLL